jgi:hypothetical protein
MRQAATSSQSTNSLAYRKWEDELVLGLIRSTLHAIIRFALLIAVYTEDSLRLDTIFSCVNKERKVMLNEKLFFFLLFNIRCDGMNIIHTRFY